MALDRSMRSFDRAGHLHVAQANISKAMVSPYLGSEIPNAERLGLSPNRVYRLFRDPIELAKAAPTFTGKPIVMVHRPQMAADHDREITVGAVGEATFTAPYLRAPLVIWDGTGIEAIQSGQQRELSCGYFFRADMKPGVFLGQPYDGRMADLAGNHAALVDVGRAGPDVVVGDAALRLSSRNFRKDGVMADQMADVLRGEQVNLKMIEAFRAYLLPKLSEADMQGFDMLWMPLLNGDLSNSDPTDFAGLAQDVWRRPTVTGPPKGFSDRFKSSVPLKLG